MLSVKIFINTQDVAVKGVNPQDKSILRIYLTFRCSSEICRLTLIIANSLDTDQAWQNIRPRSGLTKRWIWSGSKLFDTLIVFLKDFFYKSADDRKIMKNNPASEELNEKHFHCSHWKHLNETPTCIITVLPAKSDLTSCFVYKVIRDLESIDHLCINPILQIGLKHKWSIDSH